VEVLVLVKAARTGIACRIFCFCWVRRSAFGQPENESMYKITSKKKRQKISEKTLIFLKMLWILFNGSRKIFYLPLGTFTGGAPQPCGILGL
jgi:hypothetical protein